MWDPHLSVNERQGKAVIATSEDPCLGDVVPWVGAASWESRVGVAVVETRNVMVAVVQLPWTSCYVY